MAATAPSGTRPVRRRGNPAWVKGVCPHRRQPEIKKRLTRMLHAHLEALMPEMMETLTRRAMEAVMLELEQARREEPAAANTARMQREAG